MSRLPTALALALLVLAFAVSPARAGYYAVTACSDAWGTGQNNLFTAIGPYQGGCSSGYGLWADSRAPAAGYTISGWRMTAPPGTTIASFSASYFSEWTGGSYGSQVDDGGSYLAGPCFSGLACGWLTAQPWYASYGWTSLSRSGLSTSTLRLVTWCASSAGCPSGFAHSFFSDVAVALADPSNPAVAITSGQPATGTWVRGSRTFGYSASDNSGIRRTQLQVDGAVKSDDLRACDYSRATPCTSAPGSYTVDTTQLADGARAVEVEARDATDSNSSSASASLNIDNHAPVAPTVTVDGGESARTTAGWTVRWANPPAQAAPITVARYRVCRPDGSGCTTGSASVPAASGGSSQANSITGTFGLSGSGDNTLELWLEDAAGNADAAKPSAAVHLRIDNVAPGAAAPREPDRRWLGGAEATTFRVPITMAVGATVPASGIAGYAVTTDGSAPGTTVTASGASATYGPPVGGWSSGTVVVRARAISGAGVASAQVGQAVLHVDRLAPVTSFDGQGGDWQPGPVTVRLSARDGAGGSGMGAADDGDPVEAGGHIDYTLDAAALKKVAGDEAAVVVAGNGTHTITFRAYDVAGNVAADRTVAVQIGDPADAPSGPLTGFWARALNPRTTFTAAAGFGSSCPASATLTPTRDAYVDQGQPDSAFGHGSAMAVRSSAGANARALLGFSLPAASGCSVRSAGLRLYSSSLVGAPALQASRLGSAWDEEVTWRARPGATGAVATGSVAGGWTEFDVTAQVQAMYRVGDDGLVVRAVTESAATPVGQSFGSRDGVPAERPQLVVSFG